MALVDKTNQPKGICHAYPRYFLRSDSLAALVIGIAVAVFIMEVFIPVCEYVRNMWKMHKAE